MSKKLKAILALVMAFAMCLSMNTTAFAAETGEPVIPENATRHEIHLTLDPAATTDDENDNGGAQTYIWGNPEMNLIYHHTASTASFYVTDRYFGYEIRARIYDGNTTNQTYTVALKYVGNGTCASMTKMADDNTYKMDWIDLDLDGNYYFEVTNNTDYILSIFIVYYSWN